MKASVIISAYNNLADLGLLLPSLARQSTGDHEMEVILRDDGSLDGTAAWIEKYYPWIQLIQGENVGFSRSNNIAAGRTSGEVLVFINADTVLDERFIAAGLDALDRDPLVGGLNCNMIMPWIMETKAFLQGQRPAGGYGYFLNRYGFAEYREVTMDRCRTAFLSGGGCFVRRAALGDEPPFAEDLWGGTAYCEDLDLSLRLLAKGWRLCFEPAAILYHNQRPVQQAGIVQFKKFIRVSFNRITVYAGNLSRPCFLRLLPRLYMGLFRKIASLSLPEKIKKRALFASLLTSPLFFLLLPCWICLNLWSTSGQNFICDISFLKEPDD